MVHGVRQPAGVGSFYPSDPTELQEKIDVLLSSDKRTRKRTQALMVPHGSYFYSGIVSSSAYSQIKNEKVDTVFILGDAHIASFEGIVIDASAKWQTPFGEVDIDRKKVEKLELMCDDIRVDSLEHKNDFILEIQLPFLSRTLSQGFKIVPILFGTNCDFDYDTFLPSFISVFGSNDLVIVTSDMSHYPVHDEAYKIDKKTLGLIKNKDLVGLNEYIFEMEEGRILSEKSILCGMNGVKFLIDFARKMQLEAEVLNYSTSGDVEQGYKDRVVGYGSVMFY